MKINTIINVTGIYFLHLLLLCTYLHGMYESNNEDKDKTIFLKDMDKLSSEPIKGAIFYSFEYSIANIAKQDVIVKAYERYKPPSFPVIDVKYYSAHGSSQPLAVKEFEADTQKPDTFTDIHEKYCNALLDKQNGKKPNRIEITHNFTCLPMICFYVDQKLVGSHEFSSRTRFDELPEIHTMDLKNPMHWFRKYFRPSDFFSEVTTVYYYNACYLEKVLTYNQENKTTIKYTWQHVSVQAVKLSLIGILLFYAMKKCFIKNSNPF